MTKKREKTERKARAFQDSENLKKSRAINQTHKRHTMSRPNKKRDKRKNIYFDSLEVYEAIQKGILKKVLKSKTVSEHISKLAFREVRSRRDALVDAGVPVPQEAFR
jgi:DNA-directed RNA polymerase beta' subunit